MRLLFGRMVILLKRIHIFSDKSYKVVCRGWCSISLRRAIVMSFATNKHPDESVVAGGVRLVRLHDSAVYRVFRLTRRRAALPCLPDAQRIRPEHRRVLVRRWYRPSWAERAGLPVIMLDIGNAIIATAASLTITRSLLHLGSPTKPTDESQNQEHRAVRHG